MRSSKVALGLAVDFFLSTDIFLANKNLFIMIKFKHIKVKRI